MNLSDKELANELGEDTLKILMYGMSALEKKPDPEWQEWIELRRDEHQIGRLRRNCYKKGIPTALDAPVSYKGRKYTELSNHPMVKRKRRRTVVLKRMMRRRAMVLQAERARDPRTRHWFADKVA